MQVFEVVLVEKLAVEDSVDEFADWIKSESVINAIIPIHLSPHLTCLCML